MSQSTLPWLLLAIVASTSGEASKYNISYSVQEETDGPLLIGDLAGDLNLLRFYSSERLAKKRIEFLRTSPDYNSHFQVRLVASAAGGTVKHELVLLRRLDREQVCPDSALASDCYLALSCSVKPYDEPILLFTVRIFVLDVNDHAPVFDPARNTVHFSEADLVGARRPIPHAADADSGPNARVAYALETPSSQFRVDSDSQTQVYLTLAAVLDRETVAAYTLNVSARDFGAIPLTGYLQLSVVVTDTNDCFPVFDRESYRATVVENSMPKPALLVRATDGDIGENGRIKYQLAPDTPAHIRRFIEIGLEDGVIALKRPIDREEFAMLEFHVRAVDCGSPAKTSVAAVQLTVLDLNDCPPRIELPARRAGVFENRQPSTVVMSFTVKDEDLGINGSVQCALDQGARSEFEVKEYDRKLRVFQILTRDELDREAKDTFSVIVRCTDGGGLQSREGLTIIVEDENDNQPRFVLNTLFHSVPENCALGHIIANLSATDGDINENGLISYYILRDPAVPETSSFDVTRHGGTVTVTKRLDREQRSSLTLFVIAHDNGKAYQFSATATVYIEIKDVNDVAPVLPPSVDFSVEENGPPGIKLGPVRATDPDTEDGGRIAFYGGDKDSFTVTEDGYLVAKRSFDREVKASYVVQVFTRDFGTPSLTSSTLATVQIMDRNDCRPQFIFPYSNDNFSVSVHEQPGYLILKAVAKDSDETGENSRIIYRLEQVSSLFAVSESTGRLQVHQPMQVSDLGSHRLIIHAADCGVPRLETSVSIYITLLDTPAMELRSSAGSGGSGNSGSFGTAAVAVLVTLTVLLLLLIVCVLLFVLQRRRALLSAASGRQNSRGFGGEYKFIQRRRQKQPTSGAADAAAAAAAAASAADAGLSTLPTTALVRQPLTLDDGGATGSSDDFKTGDNVYCSNPYFCT